MKDPKDLQDTLKRRRRNAPRQPRRVLSANAKDIQLLHFIHLYGGMLTTSIIFEYAKLAGLYKGRRSMGYRLRDLYHDAGLLDRPIQQRNIEYPERYSLVHRVSEKGEALLKDRGLFSESAPRPYGAYEHQMMTACLYASYYIHAMKVGFGFTPQHEILGAKCNASIVVDDKNVTPDALFKLTIDGKEVLIFLEADRATEVGHSTDDKRKSWGRSVEQYKEIIGGKRYKEHYGVASTCGAQVHVVTISVAMQMKIIRQIQRVMPEGCNYILTHATSAFGDNTHPPEFMPILSTEWDRWGTTPFQFLKT